MSISCVLLSRHAMNRRWGGGKWARKWGRHQRGHLFGSRATMAVMLFSSRILMEFPPHVSPRKSEVVISEIGGRGGFVVVVMLLDVVVEVGSLVISIAVEVGSSVVYIVMAVGSLVVSIMIQVNSLRAVFVCWFGISRDVDGERVIFIDVVRMLYSTYVSQTLG